MKALVKTKAEVGVWLEDIAEPTIGHNDVLIKVNKTAICGTDLHIYNWDAWAQHTIELPLVVGHEFAGEIVEIGSEVKGFKVGERVSAEGHMTCGHCRNCRGGYRHLCRETKGLGVHRQGAFAELVAIPAANVFKLPDNIRDEVGAILDPLGNAAHTALSFDLVGEDVLITGAGPVGLLATAIAKHVGARHVVVTDVNDYRLDLARKMGATRAIHPERENINDVMKALHMTEGFDVGLEMSGNTHAFNMMLQAMNHGGKVAILGIFSEPVQLDMDLVIFKLLTLKGIYGREIFETWHKMTSMLQSGLDVAPVITHTLDYRDFNKGFEILNSGLAAKIIFDWS